MFYLWLWVSLLGYQEEKLGLLSGGLKLPQPSLVLSYLIQDNVIFKVLGALGFVSALVRPLCETVRHRAFIEICIGMRSDCIDRLCIDIDGEWLPQVCGHRGIEYGFYISTKRDFADIPHTLGEICYVEF